MGLGQMGAFTLASWAAWAGLAGAAPAPLIPLSPQAQALIAPVHEAYVEVETKQAAMPPPKDDRERLERMFDIDQAGRTAISRIDFSAPSSGESQFARAAAWDEITAHDLADQKALKAMTPPEGWFLRSKYGDKAAEAAFLIVQHAVNDPELMRTTLARMKLLVAQNEARGTDYALMYDRVALEFDQKPQTYGSQVECKDGAWRPVNLEDPAHVDERRKAMGFTQTEAQYLELFKDNPCH